METLFFGSAPFTLLYTKTSGGGSSNRNILHSRIQSRVSSLPLQAKCLVQDPEGAQGNGEKPQIRHDIHEVAKIAVTMTVVSFAIHQQPAFAKVAEKKRTKTGKRVEVMPLEEREAWAGGLPVVRNRIPYTDILRLKAEGRLKHIIKHPKSPLKARPDPILVVLDDERVVRTVLPVLERDERFWEAWDKLELDSAIVNAYTPPVPKPQPQRSILGFLGYIASSLKVKERKGKSKSDSSSFLEIQRARMELERERKAREEELRLQKELRAKAIRARKQLEARRRREEEERQKQLQSVQGVQYDSAWWSAFWYNASTNEGVRFVLGLAFFWLFYQTVVVSYKKRKKDYEDRLKIEKAEAEERKKMKQWEDNMEIADAIYASGDLSKDGASKEDKKKVEAAEKNPDVKLGLQFLRSGARVRRAKGRRPPRYLEVGADVKFSDVAGLGDIRRELEEIVEFFRYGEKYRRRGARIPG